jgi:general secretion pathway protein G
MNGQPKRRATRGFTLVELMVVISIIAILATIVGVNVLGQIGKGNQAAAKAQIKNLKTACIAYKLEYKKLPDSLEALVRNDKNVNFLDSTELPKDPWGAPYIYEKQGANFSIKSYGADGSPGGDGENADVNSENLGAEDNK